MGHVKGVSRGQGTLFPERLDDLIAADSPVWVIDAFIDRLDRRIEAYLEELDTADTNESDEGGGGDGGNPSPEAVEQALARLRECRTRFEEVHQDMQATGDKARALTDGDSRKMRTGQGEWIIGYNVQLAVEAEHGLIVEHEVTAEANDQGQLAPLALRAQAALGGGALTVVADTGYAQAEAAQTCHEHAITAIAPRQTPHSHRPGFARERFVYDADTDTYHCPGGAELRLRQEVRGQRRYMTPACRTCAIKAQCTSGQYRQVTRHRHEAALEAMDERARSDPHWMRLRRSTVEHPFGTLKRGQQAR